MTGQAEFIWLDGRVVPWAEAKVHVMCHGLHYGTNLFEGISSYECEDGRSAIFRLGDHVHRLFQSADIIGFIKIPFSEEEIKQGILEIMRRNNLKESYIRPLVIIGEGGIGPLPKDNPVHLTIIVMPRLTGYFGNNAIEKGIDVHISKWRRDNRVMPFAAKVAANYVNSAMAKNEAHKLGFDDAVMLNSGGYITEGSAANIFIVKDKVLMTPHLCLPILKGITRDTVLALIKDELRLKVEESLFVDEMLYKADECFWTGTSAEITPIREVEEHRIGQICPGPITKKLQELYSKLVRGEMPDYHPEWLTYV